MSMSEQAVGLLGIVVLLWFAFFGFVRWLFQEPKAADPWGSDVAAELEKEDAVPLCPQCLLPHGNLDHLCPGCGAQVGPYTNLMPPLYLYSIGDVFRLGTTGTFKRSPFLIGGFYFIAFVGYALVAPLFILVPVYWIMLSQNIARLRGPNPLGAETDSPR